MKPLCHDVDLIDDHMQNMNLVSSDVSDSFIPESQLQDSQANQQIKEAEAQQESSQFAGKVGLEQMAMQGNVSQMLKSLIRGKYQYLTYLLSSTACVYFWLAPSHQKM
jgi:hypothetical protein